MKTYLLRLFLYTLGNIIILQIGAMDKTYVIPQKSSEKNQLKILLNGTWDFKYTQESKWNSVQVPGEIVMQEYAIKHDKPYWYRKFFILPECYKNKRVILRFLVAKQG